MENEEEYKSFISEIECCYFGSDRECRYRSDDEKNLVRAAVYRLWFYDEFRTYQLDLSTDEIHALIHDRFTSEIIDEVLLKIHEFDLPMSVDLLCYEMVEAMLAVDDLMDINVDRMLGRVRAG